jgi:hypothetical protein
MFEHEAGSGAIEANGKIYPRDGQSQRNRKFQVQDAQRGGNPSEPQQKPIKAPREEDDSASASPEEMILSDQYKYPKRRVKY